MTLFRSRERVFYVGGKFSVSSALWKALLIHSIQLFTRRLRRASEVDSRGADFFCPKQDAKMLEILYASVFKFAKTRSAVSVKILKDEREEI